MNKRDMLAQRQSTLMEATSRLYGGNGAAEVPENALVRMDDGTLVWHGVELTRVGVKFNRELSMENWWELLTIIKTFDDSISWWLGDLFAYSESRRYGDMTELAHQLGYKPSSIQQYKYVAEKVETSIRIEVLSFGHHQVVAGLPPNEQREKLLQAAAEGWSVRQLQAAIDNTDGRSVEYTVILKRFTSSVKKAKNLPIHDRRDLAERLRKYADELEGE